MGGGNPPTLVCRPEVYQGFNQLGSLEIEGQVAHCFYEAVNFTFLCAEILAVQYEEMNPDGEIVRLFFQCVAQNLYCQLRTADFFRDLRCIALGPLRVGVYVGPVKGKSCQI